jgi:hypothetical protein
LASGGTISSHIYLDFIILFPIVRPELAPSFNPAHVPSFNPGVASSSRKLSSLQVAAKGHGPAVRDPAIAAKLMAQMGTKQDDDSSVDSRKLESPASKKKDQESDLQLDATIADLQKDQDQVGKELENLMNGIDMEIEKTPGQNKRTKDEASEPSQIQGKNNFVVPGKGDPSQFLKGGRK